MTTAFLRVVLLRSFYVFFCFFFGGGVEACARCACLLSNECRKREREEVIFVREIDKNEREREKIFFFHTRREGAAFLDLCWSVSLTPRQEPLPSLGRFPFAFDYC